MKNPFNEFFHVPNSQELLDIAFKKAMKSTAQVSLNAPIIVKAKKKEFKRVQLAVQDIIDRILNVIKSVPVIEELPDFYKELASILVDTDKLKLTLGRLNGILPILSQIQREYLRKIKRIEVPKEGDKLRRSVFGRVSSIIKKRNEDLVYLNDIRGKLREIPSIDSDVPCIVVAGYPNVGKSSIVKLISTNKKIEVQEYPFTTKKLNIGHLLIEKDFDTIRLQIIDTPGILDRPMAERNYMELQAILALRLISDLILFIFDPTPACGYSIDSQIDLYNEIKQNFAKDGKIEIVIILNKMDLAKSSEIEYIKDKLKLDSKQINLTNASTGENLDKIINLLNDRYVKSNN